MFMRLAQISKAMNVLVVYRGEGAVHFVLGPHSGRPKVSARCEVSRVHGVISTTAQSEQRGRYLDLVMPALGTVLICFFT